MYRDELDRCYRNWKFSIWKIKTKIKINTTRPHIPHYTWYIILNPFRCPWSSIYNIQHILYRVFTGVPSESHVSGGEWEGPRRGADVPRQIQREILANDPEICEHHCRTILRSSALWHVSHRLRSIQWVYYIHNITLWCKYIISQWHLKAYCVRIAQKIINLVPKTFGLFPTRLGRTSNRACVQHCGVPCYGNIPRPLNDIMAVHI